MKTLKLVFFLFAFNVVIGTSLAKDFDDLELKSLTHGKMEVK